MDSRGRRLGRLGVVLVAAQLALFVSAQDCLQAAGGRAPPFRDDDDSPVLPNGTQAIITSYKFGCCGNITAWQTYVKPGGGMNHGVYDITFQVWRPSPTVLETGCYSMVGENRYTSLSLGDGGLVSETPEPSNILTVQYGDVVGYFTLSRKDIADGIQLDDSQSVDSVWYDTITVNSAIPSCLLTVGADLSGALTSSTNAAPVLSVDLSSFSCPPTPTISPTSTSPLPHSTTTSSETPISPTANTATQMSPSSTSSLLPSTTASSDNTAAQISPSSTSSLLPSTTASAVTAIVPTGSAALSIALIAIIAVVAGGSALLLASLCTLSLAIILAKVKHKRQRTLAETPSVVADQQVNTFSMEMQGNEAYMTTSHTINTEYNLAYGTVNTGCEDQNIDEYDDILPAEPLYSTC